MCYLIHSLQLPESLSWDGGSARSTRCRSGPRGGRAKGISRAAGTMWPIYHHPQAALPAFANTNLPSFLPQHSPHCWEGRGRCRGPPVEADFGGASRGRLGAAAQRRCRWTPRASCRPRAGWAILTGNPSNQFTARLVQRSRCLRRARPRNS